jgi:hypothetical protein
MSPEQAGVAGEVDRQTIFKTHDVAGRLAHVHHLPVVEVAAAVARIGHDDAQSADVLRTTLVHRRRVRDALARQPVTHLENGHDRGAALARARRQILDVIEMAVRHEDEIDAWRPLHRLGAGGFDDSQGSNRSRLPPASER